MGDRSVNASGTLLKLYRQDDIEVFGGKPRPTYTLSTTNPTRTCLGLKLGLYALKTVTKRLKQGKV